MLAFRPFGIALLALVLARPAAAQPAGAEPGLVDQGRQLATAGDCAGCHATSLAGGAPIASPMGAIYASNITPDRATGIGSWTLRQFSDLLRRGVTPDGHIFPAMPYTSYTGLDDLQVKALYSYFMLGVAPVSNRPPETHLPFPFVRAAIIGWNALFLHEGRPAGAVDVIGAQRLRGRLLVETLGHCTACHTPRGQLMQPLSDRHLGGAMIGGWWAPNITPGAGGIADWSDEKLASFLATGHVRGAIAAGEMSKVVARSLSNLTQGDIGAIVAYLRAVPPVASTQTVERVRDAGGKALQVAALEPAGNGGWQETVGHATTQGPVLYQSACASCHGIDGGGSVGQARPSLRLVEGVMAPGGSTLVQVIAHGVDRNVDGDHALMPGFRASLSDAQIAAAANYIRVQFGGVAGNLDEAGVPDILDGSIGTPWLIRNAQWLSVARIAIALMSLAAGGWRIARARRRRLRHA